MKYCDACHSAYPDDFSICPRDQGPLRQASELLPGMILRGKYEILERIGAGGMASVYRARHLAFAEVCAIKVVAGKLAHDDTFLRRFRNEAVVTRRLQHPNAVRVDDFDTTEDGRPFIVMEFVQGLNLRDVIRQEAPLHPRRAVGVTRQVASALAAAHELGIVHRDIKPDNILLARGGDGMDHAKVLDFGIAKVKETVLGEEAYTPTRTGMVVGTPQYVSPEQAMGKRGEEIDGRSDLYSLGVVLYEMLTGRLPFASDTAMGMILHHLQTAPTPPHLARPDLGIAAPLSDLLMKALQKEPAQRYPTAADMVAALDAVVDELPPLPTPAFEAGAGAMPLRTPTPPATVTPRPSPAPQPRATPPGAHRTTPQPPPTIAGDIADRPTRLFPGGGADAPTTVGAPTVAGAPGLPAAPLPLPLPPAGPAPPVRRGWVRRMLPWMAVGLFFIVIFNQRERRRAAEIERQAEEVAAQATSEEQPSPSSPDDSDVQEGVERLLGSARATREEEIEVDVDEGVVTLSGRVGDPAVAQVAEALAESYPGVKAVRNRLRVPEAQAADGRTFPAPQVPPVPPVGHPDAQPPQPGSPQHAALADLLREGKEALQKGEVEAAVGIYGAALSLDPRNQEARRGMQEAARRMRARTRLYWRPPNRWPFTGERPSPEPRPTRPPTPGR